jgi:hypothetical protein
MTNTINKETFKTLPQEVQNDCKATLKAFSEVHVVFENGKYDVSPNVSIKAQYAPDHKFIGTLLAEEIFTKEERMVNYIEEFHDYPAGYKGVRDYRMLKEIKGDWSVKFKLEGENLVRA